MKFLHVSDTHLGYNQYGLDERGQDFFDVFSEAIDIAIENNVDFVLHTGDFFHTSRPTNQTILEGLEIVKRLNDKNIPMFCISGNHDRGSQVRDVSPLSILEPFGLNIIDNKSVEYGGVQISGMKYLSKAGIRHFGGIRAILEKLLEQGKNSSKHILMLHQEFYPFFPNSNLYMEKEIPDGFDYVGIGHYHVSQKPKKINDYVVVYPGSTEYTAYSEKENKTPKGVYLVEIQDNQFKPEFIELKKRRPFLFFEFDEQNFIEKIKDIKEEVEKSLSINKKPPVVVLKGSISEYSVKDLIEILQKEGLEPDNKKILYFNFLTSRVMADVNSTNLGVEMDEENIQAELRKLIGDNETYENVKHILDVLKGFESVDEMKKYIKEHGVEVDL